MLPPVRVLGVGSPFGLDDLAWRLIEQLQASPRLNSLCGRDQLMLEKLDRPGVNLLSYFDHAEQLYLIDVMLHEKIPPGEVVWYCHEDVSQAKLVHSSHGFGVQEALALAESLGQIPSEMAIIAISLGNHPVCKNMDWHDVIAALAEELEPHIVEKCERVTV